MSYSEQVAAERRRDILKLMLEDGGSGSEIVLEQGLAMLGPRIGLERAVVRGLMRDLEKSGLITVDFWRDSVMVGSITERGVKVSRGWITADGVAPSEPGA